LSDATAAPTEAMQGGLALEDREIGRMVGHHVGPTLIVVAGVHGNEPAGIHAARRVLSRLTKAEVPLRGELVVLAGNVGALRVGKRYVAKDLNRQWTEARAALLLARDATRAAEEDDAEDAEQRALLAQIEGAKKRARGRVYLADFHTSSAEGIPFVLFGDTLAQGQFVRAFPLPVIVGLEEQLDGALSEYWTRHGCITFTCEGGQHADPSAIDNLEAVLYLALEEAGLVAPASLPELRRSAELLRARRGALPPFLEVVSRHAISAADAFKMEPGFLNLGPAREGQLLARDARGEIRAGEDGVVILPLYQGLGTDGFFWGRAVSPTRMRTSEILRLLRVERLLGLLPGVARDPAHPRRFILRAAGKRYPRDVFHLLGYRRERARDGTLTIERQPDVTC
jgi:succinylglutamate desuccinylase